MEINLKQYLKILELSQRHVAKKINKSNEAISRIISGDLKASKKTMDDMISYLDYYKQMEIRRLSDKIRYLQNIILKTN
jgi:predicted transcriptional regulator